MKIRIIGPGAMGCLFGCHLFRAGVDVVLIDKHPARAKSLAESGITLHEGTDAETFPIPVTTALEEVADADLLLFFVKANPLCSVFMGHEFFSRSLCLFKDNHIRIKMDGLDPPLKSGRLNTFFGAQSHFEQARSSTWCPPIQGLLDLR